MNKLISIILIGLVMFSTLTAVANADVIDDFIDNTISEQESTTVVNPNYVPNNQVELDIVFVIDSTGSMHDEIRTVREELVGIMDKINSGQPRPDVRVGVVTYRDYPNQEQEYLTQVKGLTSNMNSVERFIKGIEAYGGGDYEEAAEAGLDKAINDMKWRKSAHRIIILVGDAPARDYPYQHYEDYGNEPHQYYKRYNWRDAIEDAQDKNIRIYTASGSGMDREGIDQWKTIARKTGGSYIELIYERRIIEDYYVERDISPKFMGAARASADYEASTDSVVTNNFGFFAEKSVMTVAEEAGVEYGGSLDDITGDIIQETNGLKSFFTKLFTRVKFW
jgi:hypothetical protein